jgi:protein-tyrosine phosphatase
MSVTRITDYLAIAAWPTATNISAMRELGVRLIISMTNRVPPPELDEPPFRLLHLPANDSPFLPIPLEKLCVGVAAALPVIGQGQAVAVHCSRGRHRSVAMACSILIAMGYSAKAAMLIVKEKRPQADPSIWYIRRRILHFAEQWPQGCAAVSETPARGDRLIATPTSPF